MLINVIGLGYIGLPTSLMLAAHGNKVVGTDINKKLIKKLNSGIVSFKEEGLVDLYNKAIANENISFNDKYIEADLYIVTVPTPYNEKTKKINTDYLINAVKEILLVVPENAIIVIESTISPGTTDKVIRPLIKNSSSEIELIHAPERIIPGSMIRELKENSRTIGCDDVKIGLKVKDIYKSFCESEIVLTSIKVAEMSKVVENTYRDVNIAFANELAKICIKEKIDVYEVIEVANKHPRVDILRPGPGVGGHCIPIDPWFLISDYPEQTSLIKKARIKNESMPMEVLDKIKHIMKKENIKNNDEVGIYGITYKENIDDIRESPTVQLFNLLEKNKFGQFRSYDPFLNEKVFSEQYLKFSEFKKGLRLLVIMVEHDSLQEELSQIDNNIILLRTKSNEGLSNYFTYKLFEEEK